MTGSSEVRTKVRPADLLCAVLLVILLAVVTFWVSYQFLSVLYEW
jgi:hypothetical protein